MKHFFALFTLFLMFACTTVAQTDFNFSFYPGTKYTILETINTLDTVKKQIVPKTDTVTRNVPVFVEKINGRFSVRMIANISQTVYDMNVEFVGTHDRGNMVYKAKTDAGENIFVNPLNGFVEIVFQRCFDVPQEGGAGLVKKYCNQTRHIFGNIAAPKPAVIPVKPK